MTQADEALEMMSCARCGGYSGPEVLCARCDEEATREEEEAGSRYSAAMTAQARWEDQRAWERAQEGRAAAMTETEREQIVDLIAQRFWTWPEYSRRTAMRDVADGPSVQHGAYRERVHVPADQVGSIVHEAWERSLGESA